LRSKQTGKNAENKDPEIGVIITYTLWVQDALNKSKKGRNRSARHKHKPGGNRTIAVVYRRRGEKDEIIYIRV